MIDPTKEALYITSAREIVWGIILVAVTLLIHAIGMILTQHFSNRLKLRVGDRFGQSLPFLAGIGPLILASWLIVTVHSFEVVMWAMFFQWKQCFPNFSTATYFSFLEYTTVGSAFNLPLKWRLLEGMIATAGLLAFAWSTGVLLTVADAFQQQQLQRLIERRKRDHTKGPRDSTGKS